MKKLIVLGRGESLSQIKKFNPKDFDACFIVNNFENEIKISESLREFLKESKNVFQIVGRDNLSLMNENIYKEFKIKKVILNVLKEEYNKSSLASRLKKMNVDSQHLPSTILKFSENTSASNGRAPFPTTGICCLGFILASYDCDSIDTLGIDFYKSNYFYKSIVSNKKEPTEAQIKKGDRMIRHVKKLIKQNNKIEFNINSSYNFTNS
jgi:hypothetical protein